MSLPPVSKEDYDYLISKYGKLVLYTANRISGDLARDVEDYSQEIWMLILKDLPRYLEKTGLTVKEFCEHAEYSKYIKQWIWTYKNRVGAEITNKRSLLSAKVRISKVASDGSYDNEENISLDLRDTNAPWIGPAIAELHEGKTNKDLVLSAIAFSPDTITDTGKFNRAEIQRRTFLSIHQINRLITDIYKDHNNAIKHS